MVSRAGVGTGSRALTRQVLPPGPTPGRDRLTPFARGGGRGQMTHTSLDSPGGRRPRPLDQARGRGQPGQVGAAAGAGLVPDPVQVRADGADADVQPGGDLRVGMALGDEGDRLPLPGAEHPQARRRLGLPRAGDLGEHQGVLGGGGQAHRRAALSGRPRLIGSERLWGGAQRFLPAPRLGRPVKVDERGQGGPRRDGLGGPPGRGAQDAARRHGQGHRLPPRPGHEQRPFAAAGSRPRARRAAARACHAPKDASAPTPAQRQTPRPTPAETNAGRSSASGGESPQQHATIWQA